MTTESKNIVQVSAYKPIYPYIKWSKKLFEDGQGEIEVSGLGVSIASVASISDVLVSGGFATVSKISTTRGGIGETRSNIARLQVWLKKSENFAALMAEANKLQQETRAN